MTIPRIYREFIAACADEAFEVAHATREKAKRMLSEDRAHARRVAVKAAPRKAEKATKDANLAAETAKIRAYVDRRDYACVICGGEAPEPWELHHVDSGTGKAQRQTTRNCAKTHEPCHKRAHRGDLDALRALLRWAAFHGYGETFAVVEHRIAKVEEARDA